MRCPEGLLPFTVHPFFRLSVCSAAVRLGDGGTVSQPLGTSREDSSLLAEDSGTERRSPDPSCCPHSCVGLRTPGLSVSSQVGCVVARGRAHQSDALWL